ncbi:hypothetical protein DP153_00225 [Clostridium tetani]|nr:hypothetical protein KY52_13060 [Clostridium tetani]KGI42917.1 hypothetical protein KY55_08355 [Clostridium tetani]KHO30807.1 hypothetical protein OR63_13575 [Clostridium tetani]KIG19855.1 hypothetical protein RS78_12680 [Clostridium tetani]RXI61520.1 hypothetical protein DP123_12920 [Clostridium tetani]
MLKKRLILYKIIGSLINTIFIVLIVEEFQFIELKFKYSLALNYSIYFIIICFITYFLLYEQKKISNKR